MAEFVVWAEKYRPHKIDDLIDQEHVKERVKMFLKEKNLPHMLFAGPPGTGKCVEKNTPIFLTSGIKKAIEIKEGDLVLTLSKNGKISSSKVIGIKRRIDDVYYVELEDGSNVKVTKEHPFLSLENGLPIWKSLEKLKEGDFVAIPSFVFFSSELNINLADEKIWVKLKEPIEIDVEKLYEGSRKKVIEVLLEGEKKRSEITREGNLKYGTVIFAIKKLKKDGIIEETEEGKIRLVKRKIKTNIIPSTELKEFSNVIKYSYKSHNGFSRFVTFKIIPELFEWLAYLLSEGNIRKGTFVFHNKDKRLLKRFSYLTKKVFGISAEVKKDRVIIRRTTTIYYLLNKIGINLPLKRKSEKIEVPQILYFLDESFVSSFLRGYLDGDGYAKDVIEFYSKSEKLIRGLKILLLKLGIFSKVKKEKKYFRLIISGKDINEFARKVGSMKWKFKKIKKDESSIKFAAEAVKEICSKLNFTYKDLVNRKKEIEYLFRRKQGSKEKIFKIYRRLIEKSREKLKKLFSLYLTLKSNEKIFEELENFENVYEEIKELLKEKEIRKEISDKINIRSDRLKEYADEKRIPSLYSLLKILKELKEYEEIYTKLIIALHSRKILVESMKELGISFNEISRNINESSANIPIYLNQNLSILKINRLKLIYEYITKKLEKVLFDKSLIEKLELIDFLINSQLNWVRIEKIVYDGKAEVYDFEIENSHNFIGGEGGIILHNTTLALIIARELYGENWKANVLELNASDERGIDVIRGKVKEFARTKAIGDVPFKIIIMDEADALTQEAQQALRRTMEDFSSVTRFILCCNYSSKIIEPIQSRCAVFRFKALPEKAQREFIDRVVKGENLKIDENAIQAIINIAEGDLRKVANLLQAAASITKNITADVIYEVASLAKPKEVEEMLKLALSGTIEGFQKAREKLITFIIKDGLAGEDLIKEIYRQALKLQIPSEKLVEIIEKIGEYEFRISEGGDALIQLTALLANLAAIGKTIKK